MQTLCKILVATLAAALITSQAKAAPITLDSLDWSVQHIVDNSQTVLGTDQFSAPRDNRGLALSPDGSFLYAGYNNPSGGFVRRIDVSESDVVDAVVAQRTGLRGKAIAVDDRGRVYFAEGSSIEIYSSDLSTKLGEVTGLTKTEGVAVTREGGLLVLYHTDRTDDTVTKRLLTEDGGGESLILSNAVVGTFGTAGTVSVGDDPRGVEVDSAGNVWVAGFGSDMLLRISSDGDIVDMTSVSNPFDVGFDGDTALVTRETDRLISIFNNDVTISSAGADIFIPFSALGLDPDGQSSGGSLAGIAVVPDFGFYVANEAGQTAGDRSTLGRIDGNSGFDGPDYFTDLTNDDNDPILFATSATIPEPTTGALLAIGGLGLALYRRRRRDDLEELPAEK